MAIISAIEVGGTRYPAAYCKIDSVQVQEVPRELSVPAFVKDAHGRPTSEPAYKDSAKTRRRREVQKWTERLAVVALTIWENAAERECARDPNEPVRGAPLVVGHIVTIARPDVVAQVDTAISLGGDLRPVGYALLDSIGEFTSGTAA